MPQISLSTSARYVTQQGLWSNQFTGQLTDRKIRKYALAGRYGEEAQRRAQQHQPIRGAKLVRKTLASARAKLLKDLLA